MAGSLIKIDEEIVTSAVASVSVGVYAQVGMQKQ